MGTSVEETEKQKEEESDESDTSTEARRHALEDARRVLDHELQSLNDVTQKSWRIVQFNGLVATVFAALVPIQSGFNQLTPIPGLVLAAAGLVLGYSTYTAFQTQERERVRTGPETDMYRALSDHDYKEDEYLSHALRIHANDIDAMQPTTEDKSEDVDKALLTSILGVILLVAGTLLIFIV
jgi:hypothetical protein